MDLYIISIGGNKFCTEEIDVLHLLLEDDDLNWSMNELVGSLPYDEDLVWAIVQRLMREGLLAHAGETEESENLNNISLTVPPSAHAWMIENQQDIEDAFIMLNPDMFDVTEVGEA